MLLLTLATLFGTAHAAEPPSVTIQDDGAVVGVVDLAVAPDVLRTRMQDPSWLPTISGDGTTVTVTRTDGACQILHSESPNAVMTARYDTRRCPTDTGFASTLLDSNAFKSYATSWTFEPTATGTRATYRVALSTSLWVPNGVVRRTTRGAIQDMLENLQAWSTRE